MRPAIARLLTKSPSPAANLRALIKPAQCGQGDLSGLPITRF
jgi:hypothetical protein